jgi:hypothetical protein
MKTLYSFHWDCRRQGLEDLDAEEPLNIPSADVLRLHTLRDTLAQVGVGKESWPLLEALQYIHDEEAESGWETCWKAVANRFQLTMPALPKP